MTNKRVSFAGALALIGTACASNPDSLDAAYVSPLKYSNYDCPQLSTELDYVGQRTNTLYQNLADKRKADNWQMGLGLVLFWPALFALEGGDGADAAEYSQLKGEFEALRQVTTQKRCNIALQSPDEILTAAAENAANVSSGRLGSTETPGTESQLTHKLLELDALKEKGLISDDEHAKARANALGI